MAKISTTSHQKIKDQKEMGKEETEKINYLWGTKICQLDNSISINKNISTFYVTMHDFFPM